MNATVAGDVAAADKRARGDERLDDAAADAAACARHEGDPPVEAELRGLNGPGHAFSFPRAIVRRTASATFSGVKPK